MINKVFDALSGKIRVLRGKINATFLSGHAAQDFFDYTNQEIGKETLEKVVERGNTATRPLHIAEGNADENAATLRQLRFECSEALNTARAEIAALRGSGAMTHDTLKKASEAIDTLLAIVESDDTDLDTVREVVAFIKNNKNVIDTIATNKLDKSDFNTFVEQMGGELQSITAALASKAASHHTHNDLYCTKNDTRLTNDRTAAEVRNTKDNGTFSIWVGSEAEYNEQQPDGLAFIHD